MPSAIVRKFAAILARLIIWGFAALWFAPLSFSLENNALETLDAAEISRLERGEIISDIWRDSDRNDGAIDAFAAVYIKASPQQIWAVMTNCEATLEVVSSMKSCRILESSPQLASSGKHWDVREQIFKTPFPFSDLKTVFRSEYTPFSQIKIRAAGGGMKVQDAYWVITPITDEISRVTYRATVQPKAPVPRFLLRRAVKRDTPEILSNLRDIVQARTQTYPQHLTGLSK